jgi:ribosomal protein S18 acetylase RimI-like enzyme
VKALDLALLRAWPAADERRIGPWLARLDAGITRRANSVLPLGKGPPPEAARLQGWLDEAVTIYRARDLEPLVQVTQAAWPPALERELADRGWQTEIDRTLLLVGVPSADDDRWRVAVDARPHRDWLDSWWAVDPRGDESALLTLMQLFARIASPTAFLRVLDERRTVGTALGVLVARTLVLECVTALPEARRRGVASAAIRAAWRWGESLGASRALLAVRADNLAARALYASLGLQQRSGYAYARPATMPSPSGGASIDKRAGPPR